jgi:hypothetical protein
MFLTATGIVRSEGDPDARDPYPTSVVPNMPRVALGTSKVYHPA